MPIKFLHSYGRPCLEITLLMSSSLIGRFSQPWLSFCNGKMMFQNVISHFQLKDTYKTPHVSWINPDHLFTTKYIIGPFITLCILRFLFFPAWHNINYEPNIHAKFYESTKNFIQFKWSPFLYVFCLLHLKYFVMSRRFPKCIDRLTFRGASNPSIYWDGYRNFAVGVSSNIIDGWVASGSLLASRSWALMFKCRQGHTFTQSLLVVPLQ